MLDDDTLALDLDDSRQAGVFFVTEDDLTALAALAQDAELLLCRLDLRDCDSHTELMARLQAALALPDPAPRWETLGDLLRDLGWLAARGVRYVVVSSAVRDRVLAAADVYPRVVAFYAALEEDAQRLAVIRPGAGQRGPTLVVYRLPAGGAALP